MDTVPQQPVAKPPIKKTMPIVLVLLGAVVLIGASTAYNAMTGSNRRKEAAKSTTANTACYCRSPAGDRLSEATGIDSKERR